MENKHKDTFLICEEEHPPYLVSTKLTQVEVKVEKEDE